MENIDHKLEKKDKKFKRLAEKRVPEALKKIKLVSNLSDTYNYSYTEDEVNKIIRAIRGEIDELVSSFKKGLNKNKKKFTL